MNYKDLGRRIRMLRQKQHMTQERLAEAIDMSSSFLGHIERGTRVASLETLVQIINVLDVSADYLLAGSLENRNDEDGEALAPKERQVLREILDHLKNWNCEE